MPERDNKAKNQYGRIISKGIGKQVATTVINNRGLRPLASEKAPIKGADKNERKPLIPWIKPLINNVSPANVVFS